MGLIRRHPRPWENCNICWRGSCYWPECGNDDPKSGGKGEWEMTDIDGDEFMRTLPATDDRVRVLRLLNLAYSAAKGLIRQGITLGDEYDTAALQDVYEQVGDFLWPDDGIRPQDRWASTAREHPRNGSSAGPENH